MIDSFLVGLPAGAGVSGAADPGDGTSGTSTVFADSGLRQRARPAD